MHHGDYRRECLSVLLTDSALQVRPGKDSFGRLIRRIDYDYSMESHRYDISIVRLVYKSELRGRC